MFGSKKYGSTNDAALTAIEAAGHGGGRMTALVSAFALIFSTLSLYQTVLKQASLNVYVPPVMHLGRDASGKIETLSIPITLSNRGAREGTVLAMDLVVRNQAGDKKQVFYGAYFGSRPNMDNEPFAPLAVEGLGSHSGTILFYPKHAGKNIILEKGIYQFELSLKTRIDDTLGIIDRMWKPKMEPMQISMVLPELNFQDMLRGQLVRMTSVGFVTSEGASQSGSLPYQE